ncbi:YeeE/YedE family protein [Rubrobacter indicoceani]|uniref:YeeE/YedE family protein n=1 Tax=Rubrobacter indicoceani TaxID=2051957 RepID=UPI000E5A31CC|nr:YeeE/YedE thiosulfate transporter family protein [Rubrobacter indicoceani]
MENFAPLSGLVGGVMIGLSATLLLLLSGRVAGISGIVGGIFTKGEKSLWRVAFVVGMLFAAVGYVAVVGREGLVELDVSLPLVVLGGLLVGFGTRLGSGCTSGHGVCGIARFSKRSIVATITFFVVAMVTVFIVRHVF